MIIHLPNVDELLKNQHISHYELNKRLCGKLSEGYLDLHLKVIYTLLITFCVTLSLDTNKVRGKADFMTLFMN